MRHSDSGGLLDDEETQKSKEAAEVAADEMRNENKHY